MKVIQISAILISLFILGSCQLDDDAGIDNDIIDINDIPSDSSPETSKAELGRLLFYDPILSGGKDVACATCHHPNFGYSDGRALSIGVEGQGLGPERVHLSAAQNGFVKRNSPTIINTRYNGINENGFFNPETAPMFWDNREESLEAQALGPIQSFEEMAGHAFTDGFEVDSVVNRLRLNAEYVAHFSSVFGADNSVNAENIGIAIAEFERLITATNSDFDRFQAGDQNAMSQAAIRGMDLFEDIGCDDCHSGPMFSDFELHVVGVPDHNLVPGTDAGAQESYLFRTPTLRNLSETGPYFHNGVAGNLQEAIRFYITARNFARQNGPNNPPPNALQVNDNLSPQDIDNDVRGLDNFNNEDIQDIIAFIEALNDPDFDREIPTAVPSGLAVGGNID